MNRSTTNRKNAFHQLIKASEKHPFAFSTVSEKNIYLYKIKQKITQQFMNIL